jgi:hypothetical protein
MRLWVVEHYRVLPTDPRYKELTDDQIELLFVNFLTTLTPDEQRRFYIQKLAEEQEEAQFPVEEFKKLGYSEEQLAEIREGVKACRTQA